MYDGYLQDAGRGRKRKHQAVGSAGGESPIYGSGGWREDSGKVIAEAGMILRDPSALHLAIQQVTQLLLRLQALVKQAIKQAIKQGTGRLAGRTCGMQPLVVLYAVRFPKPFHQHVVPSTLQHT